MKHCLPPCIHRGDAAVRQVPCGCGRRGEVEPVYQCAIYGECVERKSAAGDRLRVCLTCRDRSTRRLIVVCGQHEPECQVVARLLVAAGAVELDRETSRETSPVVVWVQPFPCDSDEWARRAEAEVRDLMIVRLTGRQAEQSPTADERRVAAMLLAYQLQFEDLVARPKQIANEVVASLGLPPLQQSPERIENHLITWGAPSMPHHHDLSPSRSVDFCRQLLEQPPGPWPHGWAGFPNVQAAFRELFGDAAQRACGELPPVDTWAADRGIVICSGGWRFFASLYVTVRMIRHVGCSLPIQVWYLGDRGEFDVRMQQALEPFDVGWVDGNAFARERGIPRRVLGGWELKPFAAAFCPYREVLSLDADSYPAYNPEEFLDHPEYRRVGAAFWPDQGKLEPGQWERFGLPHHDEPAWESGQFVVDKARHWPCLWLTNWLNDHSDYAYHHVYGDKDTFHFAWRKLGAEVCVPTRDPGWDRVAFLQRDFAGRTLFVHRTRDKFRWKGEIDGRGVPDHYMTTQWHSETQHIPTLPHEDVAHEFCRESSELLRPELHLALRPDTWDTEIVRSVWLRNEYRLPSRFSKDDVIVDIGAHVGGFALACLARGAGRVICVEPHPESAQLLRQNIARYGARATVIEAAAWHEHATLQLTPATDDPRNTGGASVMRDIKGIAVSCIPLSEILASVCGQVRLLKLDCEGSEYAILDGADLSAVEHVCGEAHESPRGVDIGTLLFPQQIETTSNGPRTQLFWTVV